MIYVYYESKYLMSAPRKVHKIDIFNHTEEFIQGGLIKDDFVAIHYELCHKLDDIDYISDDVFLAGKLYFAQGDGDES